MTMSVGLARIVSDPEATTLTRKALGALSTPGLLCYDNGLSIDDTGRFVIKLKSGGKIKQDADGLSMEITIGIDSHVDLASDEYDREWNARLTGTAPNFIESSVGIGTEDFGAESAIVTANGSGIVPAKVCIEATNTQLRLRYNQSNFLSQRVLPSGLTEFFSIGDGLTGDVGFHFISGTGLNDGTGYYDYSGYSGGVRINGGTTIETIEAISVSPIFTGGGTVGVVSWEEASFSLSPVEYPAAQTVVAGGPKEVFGLPTQLISWSVRMSADNVVSVRIAWFDVLAPVQIQFFLSLHRFKA